MIIRGVGQKDRQGQRIEAIEAPEGHLHIRDCLWSESPFSLSNTTFSDERQYGAWTFRYHLIGYTTTARAPQLPRRLLRSRCQLGEHALWWWHFSPGGLHPPYSPHHVFTYDLLQDDRGSRTEMFAACPS